MISDSPEAVDTKGEIKIKGRMFRGSKGLWEELTNKNVNTEFITKDDMKTYKKTRILVMTKAHLTRCQQNGNVNIT